MELLLEVVLSAKLKVLLEKLDMLGRLKVLLEQRLWTKSKELPKRDFLLLELEVLLLLLPKDIPLLPKELLLRILPKELVLLLKRGLLAKLEALLKKDLLANHTGRPLRICVKDFLLLCSLGESGPRAGVALARITSLNPACMTSSKAAKFASSRAPKLIFPWAANLTFSRAVKFTSSRKVKLVFSKLRRFT